MLLKKKIEGKKSENLKAEKKINLAQIRWFPVPAGNQLEQFMEQFMEQLHWDNLCPSAHYN